MALDYDTYVSQLSNLMVIPSTDANFTTFLPGCIDYAEQRIYRELDLLNVRVTDDTGRFTNSDREFTLPSAQGTFIVVETMNVLDNEGNRMQLVPVTKEFVDIVYSGGVSDIPVHFAPVTSQLFVVGPTPNSSYQVEVTGVIRPSPLSSANSSTFLTSYVPDLFMAASMVFATGYQRDYGAESDDPRASQSWEQQYQTLIGSAMQEQLRARFEGAAWTPMVTAPVTPPRV